MSVGPSNSDEHLMALALEEGAKGTGLTAPNPSVGAVLVREGVVLGKGFHTRTGQPHAEVEALADCRQRGNDPKGCDIYITLEPCSTSGRTPPCTQAILENGIRRVVWAVDDPNPRHQGGARELLSKAGVEVASGVLQEEAEFLHRAFFQSAADGSSLDHRENRDEPRWAHHSTSRGRAVADGSGSTGRRASAAW